MKALWRLSVLCMLCTCVAARHRHDNQQRLRQVLQQRRQRKLTTSKLLKWCYQKIGNVTLKWCKFKIHCGNKIEIEISFKKGGLSLLYQMSESFCLWDRFSLSFFFTLGIDTEVSEWLTTKNEELRRWLEKISFASWNYETDLSEENAEKVRLMNLIKRWISEAIF